MFWSLEFIYFHNAGLLVIFVADIFIELDGVDDLKVNARDFLAVLFVVNC